MASAVKRIEEAILPELETLGYELVDVEIGKENGNKVLFVYIYHKDGIGLTDCETVSHAIDPIIDELDPIPDSYFLCVSSPGLERPLKKPRDFERNIGREVELKLYQALEGNKRFEGVLLAFDGEQKQIDVGCGRTTRRFKLQEISKIKPLVRLLDDETEEEV